MINFITSKYFVASLQRKLNPVACYKIVSQNAQHMCFKIKKINIWNPRQIKVSDTNIYE